MTETILLQCNVLKRLSECNIDAKLQISRYFGLRQSIFVIFIIRFQHPVRLPFVLIQLRSSVGVLSTEPNLHVSAT